MSDLINRQAAIDIERNATVDTNPSHFEAHQKFTQFMDDAEISSFGRWQWSNGFNTALTAVGIDLKKLPSAQPKQLTDVNKKDDLISRQQVMDVFTKLQDKTCGTMANYAVLDAIGDVANLPSAQPDVIRCKDCRFQDKGRNESESWNLCGYRPWLHVPTEDEHYCGYAERRTDETDYRKE